MNELGQDAWDTFLENGGVIDTLVALVENGPVEDGNVPSKHSRDLLIHFGFAVRVIHNQSDGYTAATYLGRDLYKWAFGKAPTLSRAKKLRIAQRAVNTAAACKITMGSNEVCCTRCEQPVFCQQQKACEFHSSIDLWS